MKARRTLTELVRLHGPRAVGPGDPKPAQRAVALVLRLLRGETITCQRVVADYRVSRATATRDLALLERLLPLRRENGRR